MFITPQLVFRPRTIGKISESSVFTVAVLSTLLLVPSLGRAQDVRGTIEGRVSDSSGAVVPGVSVTVTQKATNESRTVQTNSAGLYSFPLLPVGIYEISAEKAGFKRVVRGGIDLPINDTIAVDLTLEVGAATETVNVAAESPLLETENSSLGEVVTNKTLEELPIPFGTVYFLMGLAPGAVGSGGNQLRQQPWEAGATVQVNIAGSGNEAASITMDGVSNTSRDTGGGALIPGYVAPADAISEFKLQTVSFDGTTGGTSGGTMNVSLKSGTNTLHGTAYYSPVPEAFEANTFFNNKAGLPRSAAQSKRWGGSLNGPVVIPKLYNGKDKTFFMFAYEGDIYASPQPEYGTVPTAAQRTGDFSGLLAIGSSYQIYNPFTRTAIANGRYQEQPFAGNIIPSSLISPISAALIGNSNNLPLPNVTPSSADGANNYYTNASQTVHYNTEIWRFDHNFGQNTRSFLRLDRSNAVYQLPAWYGTKSIWLGDTFGYQDTGFGWDLVHNFTPTLLMNLRVADSRYIRISNSNPAGQGINLTAAYGFPESYNNLFPAAERRTPTISVAGYSAPSGSTIPGVYDSLLWYPQENRDTGTSWTKVSGKNTFKWGFEYKQERQGQYSYGGAALGGTFAFDTTYTQGPLDNSPGAPNSRGQGLAALLLDVPTSGTYQIADSWYEESTYYGLYFQDDLKLSRKLTLNLSLRYELEGPLTERYNRTVRNINPTLAHLNGFDAYASAAYAANPLPNNVLPASQFNTLGGVQYAGVGGVPRELFQRDLDEFEPRIGFAYQLPWRSVLRGGYGIYRGPLGMNERDVNPINFNQTTNLVPTLNSGLSFITNMANPYPNGVLQPYQSSLGASTDLGQSLGTIQNPNPRAAKIQKWQMSVQHQLPGGIVMELSYIGSYSDDLPITRTLDYFPSQYLSRMNGVRDQATINFWTANVPNPFAGLVPGTSYNNNTISAQSLIEPFPQFSSISEPVYLGYSWWHGGTAQFSKRFSQGLSGQISFTHSRQMDATSFLHPDDAQPEYVVSSADFPNRFVVNALYELPLGRGKPFLRNGVWVDRFFGGWQVSGINTFQSGSPLGFGDPIYTGQLTSVLNTSQIPGGQSVSEWFCTQCPGFNEITSQQYSLHYQQLAPRFSWFRNPHQEQVDLSLFKNVRIKEKYTAQFRADALNSMNHPWFGSPNTSPTSATFGQITSENERSRWIQFLFKFIF